MFDKAKPVLIALVAASLTLPMNGCCSLIGLGIGAIVDNHSAHGPLPPRQWDRLEPGRLMEVTRVDGTKERVTVGADSMPGSIPIDEIAALSIPSSRKGRAIGMAVGMVIDITAAVIVSQQELDFGSFGPAD